MIETWLVSKNISGKKKIKKLTLKHANATRKAQRGRSEFLQVDPKSQHVLVFALDLLAFLACLHVHRTHTSGAS